MKDSFQALGDVAGGVVAELGQRIGVQVQRPATREEWLAGKTKTIGASELAALFGVHPYMTPFELFAIKSGLMTKEFAEAEIEPEAIHLPPTERGNLFEDDAFELIARLRPDWVLTPNPIPGGDVYVDATLGMSSTPDLFAVEPRKPGRSSIQVKTMNDRVFREQWEKEGVIEPPYSVAIQAIADATLSDCDRAYAAAMVVGYKTSLYLVEVPLMPVFMVKARALVKDFWRRIRDNDPYPPNFAKDGELIASIYKTDDGAEADWSDNARVGDIVRQRDQLTAIEKMGRAAAEARQAFDAELRYLLKNATSALLPDGRVLEAKTINRKASVVKIDASSYRTVKIKEPQNEGRAP